MNPQEFDCLDDAALSRRIQCLATAVLVQAMEDMCGGTMRKRREAIEWIRRRDVGEFTFDLCCHLIDRDPETVQRQAFARGGIREPFFTHMQEHKSFERLAG
jgi:hypothetical protein